MFFPRPRAAVALSDICYSQAQIHSKQAPIRDAVLLSVLSGSTKVIIEVLAFLSGLSEDEVERMLDQSHDKGLDALCRIADLPAPLSDLVHQSAILLWNSQFEMACKTQVSKSQRLLERLCTLDCPAIQSIDDSTMSQLIACCDGGHAASGLYSRVEA